MTNTPSQTAVGAPAGITLAVLGCGESPLLLVYSLTEENPLMDFSVIEGELGTAVLQGLLYKSELDTDSPTPLISRVLATVRSAPSARRVRQKLQSVLLPSPESNAPKQHPELVVLLQEENARAVRESDVVMLGCKSNAFRDVLGKPDVRLAFLEQGRGKKVLVSLLGGVTVAQLKHSLDCSSDATGHSAGRVLEEKPCEIIRAIPNMAARVRQSMTVLSLPTSTSEPTADGTATTHNASGADNDTLPAADSLVGNLFARVGATEWLPERLIDNGASLCAATPALFATLIEAVATSDGAVAIDTHGGKTQGNSALRMAAYAARGTADLLLVGQSPEEIRKEVATEGGATRRGLDALDRMDVAKALRKSMAEIFAAAGTLGGRN